MALAGPSSNSDQRTDTATLQAHEKTVVQHAEDHEFAHMHYSLPSDRANLSDYGASSTLGTSTLSQFSVSKLNEVREAMRARRHISGPRACNYDPTLMPGTESEQGREEEMEDGDEDEDEENEVEDKDGMSYRPSEGSTSESDYDTMIDADVEDELLGIKGTKTRKPRSKRPLADGTIHALKDADLRDLDGNFTYGCAISKGWQTRHEDPDGPEDDADAEVTTDWFDKAFPCANNQADEDLAAGGVDAAVPRVDEMTHNAVTTDSYDRRSSILNGEATYFGGLLAGKKKSKQFHRASYFAGGMEQIPVQQLDVDRWIDGNIDESKEPYDMDEGMEVSSDDGDGLEAALAVFQTPAGPAPKAIEKVHAESQSVFGPTEIDCHGEMEL